MRIKINLLFLSSILILGLCTQAVGQTVLRMATSNTHESIQGRYATKFAELVSEKTDGEIEVQIFCCSQLGDAQERIEGAHIGVIDVGIGDFAALAQFAPELAVFNAPYIYRDVDHALGVTNPDRSELARDLYARLEDASNLTILGSFYYGVRQLTTTDFPVYTPDDLSGKRIRAIPNEIFTATIAGLGAIPTQIPFSEVPTALATGVVDGQENPLATIMSSSLFETQDYLVLTGHMTAILAFYANENRLNSLPDEHSAAVREAVVEAAEFIRDVAEQEDVALLAELEENGMTVIDTDDGLDREAFRERVLDNVRATFPEWDELIERIGEFDN